jgi:glutamine synthetase
VLRAKLVPAQAIAEMQRNGAGFAGFATWLDMTPAHPDLFAKPDPDSLISCPGSRRWLARRGPLDGRQAGRQAPRNC